jgi:serine/threonine protein kinase
VLPFPAPKRFEVIRRLGEGGMGIVYEAHDHARDTRVALKRLRAFSSTGLARFKREFRALQDVHHPNLVSLVELVSEEGEWFLTMELVEGCDFVEYVRVAPGPPPAERSSTPAPATNGVGPAVETDALAPTVPQLKCAPRRSNGEPLFAEDRLRSALRQLASAVGTLHAAGLVHRDIKPSNIRVTAEGRVVLLDFGLVTDVETDVETDDRTSAGKILGTPAYMAPEQAAGGIVGPSADWYAVGVLLYESLTGGLPFAGSTLQILLQKQKGQPPPPADCADAVPSDLNELCVMLLHFDPRARAGGAEVSRVAGGARPETAPVMRSHSRDGLFVGRAEELKLLRGAFEETSAGQPISVVVSGESGIGKSTLVRRFLDTVRLEDSRTVILAGRCYERESVPYKAFDGVVDELTRMFTRLPEAEVPALLPARFTSLAQLFPVLQRVEAVKALIRARRSPTDPVEVRRQAFAALRELLERLTERRRVVVVIDDAQWADTESRILLREVLRPPDAPPLLLVATARGTHAADATTSARTSFGAGLPGDVRVVQLGPLSPSEGCELASQLLLRAGQPKGTDAGALAQEAQGHPLFIDALVRHHDVVPRGGGNDIRLEDALWSRVEALDDLARTILSILAIATGPVRRDALERSVSIGGVEVAKCMARLRAEHLIQASGAGGEDLVDLYHDRVRATVCARLAPAARRALHRSLALALQASGRATDAEVLSAHWTEAEDPALAAHYAALAANQASAALAFDRAARLYERALSLRTYVGNERQRLLTKQAEALANGGRGAQAAKVFQLAAEGAPAQQALDLRRRAFEQLLRSGHIDEGIVVMRAVLSAVGMTLPRTPLALLLLLLMWRCLVRMRGIRFRERDPSQIPATVLARVDICWSAAIGLGMADHIAGAAFQGRHLLLALRAGEPYRAARAIALEVAYVATGGGATWGRTQVIMARATDLAERSERPEALGFATFSCGFAHFLVGDFQTASRMLAQALESLRNESSGMWLEIASAQWALLDCLGWRGELREQCRLRPGFLREARDRADVYSLVNLRIGNSCLATLVEDDPVGARREIADAMEQWSKQGFHLEHLNALHARVTADLYAGDGIGAYRAIQRDWRQFRLSGLGTAQLARVVARWKRASSALAAAEAGQGDLRELLGVARRDARTIESENWGWCTALATLMRAGIAMVGFRDEERARVLLEQSASAFDEVGMGLHAAAARRCLGRLKGGDEGRALVASADAWLRSQTVRKPARLAAVFTPGFARLQGDT